MDVVDHVVAELVEVRPTVGVLERMKLAMKVTVSGRFGLTNA
jgi:hypothetical protein